ncbi:calcineurin-like phosphoesterase family protein [Melghirimyces profundicolus]|uniref:Calcineurin-like phosphoesterase family protein n=1 Tax=Melghirimyces profundicolus TaxID=1242148 RepID=A0A2T6BGY7_9BACL|nr:metallophosphoesterase family protein [Melghirimyces profundicolus]PTX55321.1 calcineurin-like phosphoesterase family protein [Melghirimyces profundicolus]
MNRLRREEDTDVAVFGHVHHAFVRCTGGVTVVNTGSIGLPFDGDPVIDLNLTGAAVQLRRVNYDREKAIRVAKEREMPDVELFEEGLRTASYPYFKRVQKV